MKNWWIKFGCFLTGYNYRIVNNSSEVAAKSVKRYTAALLIVCILWAFIGFTFTQRYLHASLVGSIAGALVFVTIIVQIERQIILSIQPGFWLYLSRGLIAAMMSMIGAIIIDQIIFKEDIELEKITSVRDRVNDALPDRTAQLNLFIAQLDTVINKKESQINAYRADIDAMPFIQVTTTEQVPVTTDHSTKDTSGVERRSQHINLETIAKVNQLPNPKQELIKPLESEVLALREKRSQQEAQLLEVRPELEKEIKAKTGFLDELKIMHKLIRASSVATGVWLLWFFFILGLEMLVLISKINDKKNDYEETIMHQMNLQKKKLALLHKLAEN